jgi:hypothetical protein
MTKTVLVEITTKVQEFPLGTPEGMFRFAINDKVDGRLLSFVETQSTGASFPLIPEGTFIASCSKNGVVVTQEFTVEPTVGLFLVPDVMTVTIS